MNQSESIFWFIPIIQGGMAVNIIVNFSTYSFLVSNINVKEFILLINQFLSTTI